MKGEKAFLVVLKNCPAVICLQHYASMLSADVVLGGKVYRSSGIMLGKVLASGQELSGDHHIPWFWHCRKCGAGATSTTRPVECSHCKADIQQLDVKRYLQPVGFATDIRYQAHNDVSMPAQLPRKIHVFLYRLRCGFLYPMLG